MTQKQQNRKNEARDPEDFGAGFEQAAGKKTEPEDGADSSETQKESSADSAENREKTAGKEDGADSGSHTEKQPDMATLQAEVRQAQAMLAEVLDRSEKAQSAGAGVPGGTTSPGTNGTTPSAERPPEAVDALYRENPAIREAVRWEAERLLKERFSGKDPGEAMQTLESLQERVAQDRFERTILSGYPDADGEWVDGHPDAFRVLGSRQFQNWLRNEAARDPALNDVADPREAIRLISRFKSEAAARAASGHDRRVREEAERRIRDAAGALEGAPGLDRTAADRTQDFDSAFREAVASIKD
jgi:hypothetical protein